MINKTTIISIIVVILITITIVLSPLSLTNRSHCKCGGCCVGCPGDCNSIGTPVTYYYWGVNELTGKEVNQISIFGIIANTITWLCSMFLIYKFIYKNHKIIK